LREVEGCDGDMNYIENMREMFKRFSGEIAIVDRDATRETSYKALDELSGRIATKLRAEGCKDGDFVAILLDREMEYVAAFLGILKAGCGAVSLIKEYPKERIDFITEQCETAYIIKEHFLDDISGYPVSEPVILDENRPAMLVYTSGSTGTPKGILHSIRSVGDSVNRHSTLFADMREIKFGATAPMSFVAFVMEYLTVLCQGGCVHILSDTVRKNIRELEAYFSRHRITSSFISPQMLKLFRETEGLERVFSASERLSGVYSENYEIFNLYGMSETLAGVTAFKLDKKYDNTPIGTPLGDIELFLLDEENREVAFGETGEICVKGILADAYYKMPSETAQRILPQADGRVLVHTGDMGYFNEDGQLVYTNRKDWMVKINGQRVETLEIERLMMSIDGVETAVVKAFEDVMGQTYLAAFYTANGAVNQGKIMAVLGRKLPGYMIPRYFKQLEEMPKNINGKLDRKALMPPEIKDYKAEYVPPQSELQKLLCKAVEEILKCGTIGIKDDFFRLGGDSIKVLSLIAAEGLSDLTPEHVFRGRTIERISRLYEESNRVASIEHHENLQENYPLTQAQMGVYLQCINEPDSKMYNLPMYCVLPRKTNVSRFAAAVKTVIETHKVLGITIGAGPSMRVSDFVAEIPVKEIEDFDTYLEQFIRPFDLEQDSLWRAEVLVCKGRVYFVFDIHHIVFDGSSMKVFIDRIADVYNGKEIEEEALTLFDVALYEENLAISEEYREAQAYFEQKLSGIDADSRPVPDVVMQNGEKGGAKITLTTEEELSIRETEHFVREKGITENTLFLSAFAYTLAKFNGAKDAYFCTVNNGRHDTRLVNSIGMFVKTLPMYFTFEEKETVDDYVNKTQDDFFETMKHDCISFGELAATYGIGADIAFVYQADLLGGAQMEGESFEVVSVNSGDVQFDIDVMMVKRKSAYELIINYRKELYSAELMKSFGEMLIAVIKGMLTEETLSDIEPVNQVSRRMIDRFNETQVPYDTTATIISLFKEQAQKMPDHVAVVYEDREYTYRQLDEITDILAQNLRAEGVGKEDVVAVLIPRSEYIAICSLGILKAGCGYLPLDPTYPPERLNLMVEDSCAKILLTTPEYSPIIREEFNGKRIMISEIEYMQENGRELPLPAPEDLFIMLYTSGSTGIPKGVMLEHGNLNAFCDHFRKKYQMDETSVAAAYASYGFDACMMDLYPVLTAGGTVLIVQEELRLDLKALQELYAKKGVTNAFITTQVGRQFALMDLPEKLKFLLVGGEKLVPVEPPKGCDLYNAYGPTECTVFITEFHVDKKYADVPIGKPLQNVKLYVTDANGKLLPMGAVGELWVAGPQVSRGYLNRPEQTAAAFTKNPFSEEKGYDRVYHTGDIVRLMADGNIQFIGRRDAQVKIRGFRIELTEVEEVIRRFGNIKDATVAAFEEPSGGKYIAAYIVSDETIDINALNEFILAEKPPYMVPAVTMQIDAIPYNQNQKVNKRALPIPERTVEDLVLPKNEMQQKIFDCISEIIGHQEFGINTNIYAAGLTSIGAVRLNVLFSDTFGVPVKSSDLKENDTVVKLEAFFGKAEKAEVFEIFNDYGITKTQEGIYVESVSKPDATIYNIPVLLEISEAVELEKLKSAVVCAVNAHPYIKTRLFLNEEGDVRQRRMDGDFSFDEAAIEVLHAESLEQVKDSLVKPFKLLGGSLFRVKIIQADKNYLFIEMHHIISDGSSMLIFLNDITKAYRGEKLATESYSGYEVVLNEQKLRKGDYYTKAKAYYTDLLSDAHCNSLPAGDLRESGRERAETIEYVSSNVTAEAVEQFCTDHKLGMNAFFTAVFGLVLAKYCGADTPAFASIYNGRSDSRLSDTVSMLVKTLPVVSKISDGEKTVTAYVSEMGKQLVDSMSMDIYSFAEISRELSANAEVMFAYQGSEFVFDSLCDAPAVMHELRLDSAKAPLNVNVFLKKNQICWVCEYNGDRFSQAYIEGFAQALEKAAEEFLTKTAIKEISILSDRAKEQIDRFNQTDCPMEDLTCHRLLARSAAVHADKKAVICADKSYTYKELNENANRIANRLITDGIKPEDRVAVLMPRCIEAYAVREGVIKSGGAFIPVDPEYPDDRISYIMSDSNAQRVITTEEIGEARKDVFAGCTMLYVETLLKEENTANPQVLVSPENLVYCIYTSGSTGKPKGVMIEHRNLANFVMNNKNNPKAYGYREFANSERVVLALAALTFDVSVVEEAAPLYNGATVAMATEEEIHNPVLLAEMMKKNGVDVMKCTPSYMNNMLDIPQTHEALAKVQFMVIGAEAFPAPLYQKLRDAKVTADISNSYGPTEITVSATIDHVTDDVITIGGPLANAKVFMLDKFGNCLPPHVPGELTITGAGVGRGYVGKEELSKDKFFVYDTMPAYKSGDLARYNGEGRIVFMGRMDNQVKLRGLRVELDEIESVMNSYDCIKQSVVLLKGDEQQGQFLCGYFTASKVVDISDLTEHLKKSLTHYMVPSVFVQLEKMPMTGNGKVDKRSLPEPETAERKKPGREPKTELEHQFCDMFAQVLGVPKIFADDDFFECGGTSLSASKIAMKCMVEKLPIVYKDVFEHSTPEKLAGFVQSKNGNGHKDSEEKIEFVTETLSQKEPKLQQEALYDVLKYNVPEQAKDIVPVDIGNVLVTGATGFLGIHVARKLLESDAEKIFCLVRPGKTTSAAERLKMMLMYYFDDTFEDMFDNRIVVIEGDITDHNLPELLQEVDFDTIINCAACVKHFTTSDILERVNFHGVENLVDICVKLNKRLVQISTTSVAGASINGNLPENVELKENMLDFGQVIENKYAYTKWMAEKAVLTAVKEKGLRGKIVRVGNLMSREEDGEFQANFRTNGFMNRLKAYKTIGAFPVGSMDQKVEFSAIDYTAQAIILLAGTPDKFTVFHANSCHTVHMANVLSTLKQKGIHIRIVDDEQFSNEFAEALADEKRNMSVSPLISYNTHNKSQRMLGRENVFTVKALYRLGFGWPLVDEIYIEKAMEALMTLGFFEG